jgi:hypothetical protein
MPRARCRTRGGPISFASGALSFGTGQSTRQRRYKTHVGCGRRRPGSAARPAFGHSSTLCSDAITQLGTELLSDRGRNLHAHCMFVRPSMIGRMTTKRGDVRCCDQICRPLLSRIVASRSLVTPEIVVADDEPGAGVRTEVAQRWAYFRRLSSPVCSGSISERRTRLPQRPTAGQSFVKWIAFRSFSAASSAADRSRSIASFNSGGISVR